MKQTRLDLNLRFKRTRKQEFLAQMAVVIPWADFVELIAPFLAALQELARLVKPGGSIILTAPFCILTHFAPYHYATGLSRYWYEMHLFELGFTIVEVTPNGGWLDYLAQEIWRLPWIGRNYSSRTLGWLALILALPLIGIMRLMMSLDRGSSKNNDIWLECCCARKY